MDFIKTVYRELEVFLANKESYKKRIKIKYLEIINKNTYLFMGKTCPFLFS